MSDVLSRFLSDTLPRLIEKSAVTDADVGVAVGVLALVETALVPDRALAGYVDDAANRVVTLALAENPQLEPVAAVTAFAARAFAENPALQSLKESLAHAVDKLEGARAAEARRLLGVGGDGAQPPGEKRDGMSWLTARIENAKKR